MQRLEQRKQQLRDLLKQVQADVQKSKEMADQAKSDVQAKLEHLQVQLALGKADTRGTFEEQRTKILKALNEFESRLLEQKLKGAAFESGRVWEDLVGLTSTLEAEFEALKGRFESEKAKQQVMLESKKQELLTNLVLFKRPASSRPSAWWCRPRPMFLRPTCARGWTRLRRGLGGSSNREERGGSQTILLARRGRTIRMCSLDARSKGQSGCSPLGACPTLPS